MQFYTDEFIKLFPEDKIVNMVAKHPDKYADNEFMTVSHNACINYQQLASDFVLILSKYDTTGQYNILATMESEICVQIAEDIVRSVENHRHDYMEGIYIVNGELDFAIENKYFRYRKGDFCIINQNVTHREIVTGECEVMYFSLSGHFMQELAKKEYKRDSSVQMHNFIWRNMRYSTEIDYLEFHEIKDDSVEQMEMLCMDLMRELIGKKAGYRYFVQGYVDRIFSCLQDPALFQCNNIRYTVDSSSDLFEQIVSYIQTHRYKVDRKELSEALHYNGNYIGEVFASHTGMNLAEYIRSSCLQEAAGLLLNTEMSMTEIISSLHYENRTTFYRLFKERYGITPLQYRKNQGIRR